MTKRATLVAWFGPCVAAKLHSLRQQLRTGRQDHDRDAVRAAHTSLASGRSAEVAAAQRCARQLTI